MGLGVLFQGRAWSIVKVWVLLKTVILILSFETENKFIDVDNLQVEELFDFF